MSQPSYPQFELVFHPPQASKDGASAAFADKVEAVRAASKGALCLVSPYLGATVLGKTLGGRAFRLVTDLQACFDADGDAGVYELLRAHPGWSRHLLGVHAKVLFNDAAALLGSANFTRRGLAERDELGCFVRAPQLLTTLAEWFEALWESSEPITPELLDKMLASGRERAHLRRKNEHTPSPVVAAPQARPQRTLGWMQLPTPRTTRRSLPEVTTEQRRELATTLRRWTRTEDDAKRVLDLFAEALKVAAMNVNDPRLHVTSGSNKQWPIIVTIAPQHAVWINTKRQLGVCVGDDASVEEIVSRFRPHVSSYIYFQKKQAVTVPIERIQEVLPVVRERWHRTIRTTLSKTTKTGRQYTNPYRRHHRPELYAILMDEAARTEVAGLAFLAG